ncbi:MAG: ABC transporter permease [Spirochaetota bacterium]
MKHFFRSRSGVAGLVILGLLCLIGAFGPLLAPYPEAASHWRDIGYWQDSPAAVPPAWTRGPWNYGRIAASARMVGSSPEESATEGGASKLTWRFSLNSSGATPGRDLVLVLPGEGQLPVLVGVKALDGGEHELARRVLSVSGAEPARLAFPAVLGRELAVTEYLMPGGQRPGSPTLLLIGQVSGLLGTDVAKRDIFTGIVLGIRWALLLGVLVSFITVMTGIILAIGAACTGGWVDLVINRIYEFFSLMPILPFLIVLSAVFKPSLWTFAALALLFFWTKAFKPVYAMALQIREEGYIEAGRSIGTGRLYRAFKYVLPALLPYGFSIMALSVPGIILYEAGISILGLGDSTVVTWGQMLHDALVQGAVINRLWWWILPPGLMISITGIGFALLGRGLERVWDPRG